MNTRRTAEKLDELEQIVLRLNGINRSRIASEVLLPAIHELREHEEDFHRSVGNFQAHISNLEEWTLVIQNAGGEWPEYSGKLLARIITLRNLVASSEETPATAASEFGLPFASTAA